MAFFDLRPNIYKVGIYKCASRKFFTKVFFLSEAGVYKNFYDPRYQVERSSDVWLLEDINYAFLNKHKL